MPEETPKQQIIKTTSLKEFIDDHQKMLSVAGVLIVIGLFFRNSVPQKQAETPYGAYLAFMAALLILGDVLWNFIKHKSPSWSILAFFYLFGAMTLYSATYVIGGFPSHSATLLANVIWLGSFLVLSYLVKRFVQKLKTSAYNKAVQYNKLVNSIESYEQTKKNELISERNTNLTKFYKDMNRAVKVIGVALFLLTLLGLMDLEKFFQGFILPSDPWYSVPEIK